ncbi:MAG: polysaccharide pyruvyl transferase family protein [Sulfuricurvum sp.]|uniref:polysaccharide pyruvyl transferase family protein n=1 Tax=Sulfuricurvum sp. TaxID=2025608 RepID=UPI00260E1F7F|nr:polysaccharide pyruvyl transferase family protein [Sulfuricurvum sp.]MDD2367685.1 polysaccharide pyruvyl transferase family protein [Sulfuricurvum sp.]MDD2949355.1 polysaccharide pyruvyl transferase family protein [Sulfuricurvum sp.]MDD5118610.1 polysaccharide pyruvyl transferase family protein [Sulfuricurvum sp.]
MKKNIKKLLKIIKTNSNRIKYRINDILKPNALRAYWYSDVYNFGDAINPLVIQHFSHKDVTKVEPFLYNKQHYFVIGSILGRVNKNSIVWGSGFISETDMFKERPLKIHAVRGPKTRKKLLDAGVDCPEVYGDPALLLPKLYNPKIKKIYSLGIIAHYFDKDNSWLQNNMNNNKIKIIDVSQSNPFGFIDDILSCEKVVSSSLHGIITADAYGIPAKWIKLSNKLHGGDFKFLDYFLSVKRKDTEAFVINADTSLDELNLLFNDSYKIQIDLDKLIQSCPFDISSRIV